MIHLVLRLDRTAGFTSQIMLIIFRSGLDIFVVAELFVHTKEDHAK